MVRQTSAQGGAHGERVALVERVRAVRRNRLLLSRHSRVGLSADLDRHVAFRRAFQRDFGVDIVENGAQGCFPVQRMLLAVPTAGNAVVGLKGEIVFGVRLSVVGSAIVVNYVGGKRPCDVAACVIRLGSHSGDVAVIVGDELKPRQIGVFA